MSVQQDNRITNRIRKALDLSNRIRNEREAMMLPRAPRPVLAPIVSDIATRGQIAAWMLRNVADYSNETELVEGANCVLKLPHGCMDDATHWIWDVAVNITDRAAALA